MSHVGVNANNGHSSTSIVGATSASTSSTEANTTSSYVNSNRAARYALTAGGVLVSSAVECGATAGGAAVQGAGSLAANGLGRAVGHCSSYVLGNGAGTAVGSAIDVSLSAAAYTASSGIIFCALEDCYFSSWNSLFECDEMQLCHLPEELSALPLVRPSGTSVLTSIAARRKNSPLQTMVQKRRERI
eukprot:gb/GECG01014126.1/.p1 GENE.gb/GECG01014126.1/~~gb/GECG01014126.1/.p1  ORF type:complete len:188 (+),score=27.34 gb/GECG01014126.1/:1-564(+)